MNTIDPAYISALERGDIKRYPNELERIANRGVPLTAPSRAAGYAEIAEDIGGQANSAAAPATAKAGKSFSLWEQESFGFGDFLDIINPLHHVPIVATLYRNMSDDKIGMAPRVIGGALWGRIGGFVSGIVNALVSWFTGKDIGDHIYAALFGKPDGSDKETAVASTPMAPSASPETEARQAQQAVIIGPTARLATEEPSQAAAVAEPASIQAPREISALSSKSPLASLAAPGRPLIYPYMRAPTPDESEEDAPRVRLTV
jgi:hypothetical protein